ncbi:MAG: GDP-mannose 4,6-dehydratase [Lentisphaeria bacterium]
MQLETEFRNKNVLITGGLGFIGSNLARRLVKMGAYVTIVDSLIPEYGGNLFNIMDIRDEVRVSTFDIRETKLLKALVSGQDYIFNLAGQTSHMDSMQDPYTDLEINCRAQLSLLEICRTVNPETKIVFASTRQMYGKPDSLPVDENHLLRPVDVNGINKMAGEWYHILYNNVYGIRTCALRLTNTIGPRMRIKDARQTFLGIWVRLLLEGQPFEVWDGHQLRDFNYVDDAVDAFLMAAASPEADGEFFNLGSAEVINLNDLADLLIAAAGQGGCVHKSFPADRKKIDIGDFYSDFTKIKKKLNWYPKTSLKTALANTVSYYRKNLKQYV